MNEAIRIRAMARGIKRLCHFTPSRNLVHIATQRQGVLATQHLRYDEKAILNPTDLERLDGYPDHVCCSIQYPNAWYFRKAQQKEGLFRDWVVLLIAPQYLWLPGTKFSPRNAAANYGRNVRDGAEAFEALFTPHVEGAYGKTFRRSASHPLWLPTDDQAEVLIPDRIQREDILGVAVRDDSQAKREAARLEQLNEPVPRIVIAPLFFSPEQLSRSLRNGDLPAEEEYDQGGDDNA
jgi:hypothetical protein